MAFAITANYKSTIVSSPFMKNVFSALIFLLLASCSSGTKENLPHASGASGDIYLIMDAEQWKGELGAVLDSVFNAEMPGLPHDEKIFHMRWIDPIKLNFVLKQGRNLIFVTTLDKHTSGAAIVQKLFTPQSLEKIKEDTSQYVKTTANVYARGQEVMYLYGNSERNLLAQIRKNQSKLVEFFNVKERERLTAALSKKEVKGVSTWMQKNFQASMHIPFGYKLVTNEKDFLWVRQINPKDDRDVFIARKKYISQDQFRQDSIIAFRDQVCRKYLFEDPDRPDTYLMTETTVPFLPVQSAPISFNNHFAMKTIGLWRTNNLTMGGPFMGISVVDDKTGWFYYLEGFTFSPSRDQREIMRELETILYSFRTQDQLPAQQTN